MALSSDLLSQFAKSTKEKTSDKKESIVYGTVKSPLNNGVAYVHLDGAPADEVTPVSSAVNLKNDDRVIVMIKNHHAVVTANTTGISAQNKDVEGKVDKEDLKGYDNELLSIRNLISERVTTEELNAVVADIEKIYAEKVVVYNLTAQVADIESLKADKTVVEKLAADLAEISNLKVDKADIEALDTKYATITSLATAIADINRLSADYASFKDATVKDLSAINADIESLGTKYANIDFSNIGKAAIEYFYATSGLIKDVIVGNGTITGELVGVTIKGNLIEGGTVKADKLVIKGSDGLYYKLNTDGVKTEAEQTEYNSINGSVILAKSITATKINVSDLVAFDATIGGFKITNKAIHSSVKETVHNTTAGIYMDSDGQIAIGDNDNFIKFYQDTDGSYKLKISAVDKLEIESRNLLLNTGGDDFPVLSEGANLIWSHGVKTVGAANGVLTLSCDAVSTGANAAEIYYRFMSPSESTNKLYCLKAGESYTLSGKAKVITTKGTLTRLAVRTQNNIAGAGWSQDNIATITEADSDKWVYFKSTFMIDPVATGCYTSIQLYFDTEWGGTIQLKELKLQKGTKDTGWSPAPEDLLLSEQAEKVYATKSALSIESDRITSSVTAIAKLQNEKIGATNLLLNAGLFPVDNPIVLSSEKNDGYRLYFDGRFIYTPKRIAPSTKLVLQACTDAKWGDYHGYDEESQKEVVNMWLYWYNNVTDAANGTNNYIRAQVYFGDGASTGQYIWHITAPEAVHTTTGEWYACLRLNTYSDGTEVVTHKVWNIQLEEGDRTTAWRPCPDDMATTESLKDTNNLVEAAEERIGAAETLIQQLSNSISMLVTDGNGTSLMTQTEDGWTFSTANIQQMVNSTSEKLDDLVNTVTDTNGAVSVLQQAVADLGTIAEYVKIGTYEGEPCIELGESDSDFKLLITNTRIMFREGSGVPAYFNNQSMHIKKAVIEEELQQGGFMWKVRANGNLGLVWKGATS